jgi:hypothetical protein
MRAPGAVVDPHDDRPRLFLHRRDGVAVGLIAEVTEHNPEYLDGAGRGR